MCIYIVKLLYIYIHNFIQLYLTIVKWYNAVPVIHLATCLMMFLEHNLTPTLGSCFTLNHLYSIAQLKLWKLLLYFYSFFTLLLFLFYDGRVCSLPGWLHDFSLWIVGNKWNMFLYEKDKNRSQMFNSSLIRQCIWAQSVKSVTQLGAFYYSFIVVSWS